MEPSNEFKALYTRAAVSPPSVAMDALISLPQVETFSGIKRSQIYSDINLGKFPKPVKIGTASRWSVREVQQWIAERKAQRAV